MEARVPAPVQFDGTPVTLYPEPASTAEETVLVVRDAGGNVVERVPVAVSDQPLTWLGQDQNGTLRRPGFYSFSLESYARGDLIATSEVDHYAQITEARLQGGETMLLLQGGVEVAAGSITALRDPSASL